VRTRKKIAQLRSGIKPLFSYQIQRFNWSG